MTSQPIKATILSRKQKEIIRFMREGRLMYKNVTITCVMGNGCSVATFFTLLDNQLIKPFGKKNTNFGQQYILTKLGKTIQL